MLTASADCGQVPHSANSANSASATRSACATRPAPQPPRHAPPQPPAPRLGGWSLSEVLVVLAIVGILLALALPSYQQHQRTVRRGDARAALQQVQLEQARYRSVNERYASSLAELGWASDLSPARAYRLHISQASAEGYEVQALPLGAQAADRACQPMRLTLLPNASVVYGSGEQADADPGRCWP